MQLNALFGSPTKVQRETCNRPQTIFCDHALPFMEQVKPYMPPAARALIVGCGDGLEIEWFATNSESVVAVDIDPKAVEKSRQQAQDLGNVECRVVESHSLPFDSGEFDVLFMHNVCEHLVDIDDCFPEYFRVLKPGGYLFNQFAPLFYSPYGAHLQYALKMPWGHLLFGLQSVVEVRNIYYPGVADATSWAEFGLNRLTERRYRRLVERCGFVDEYYQFRTSKNLPLLGQIPLVRNLFVMGVTNILRKP